MTCCVMPQTFMSGIIPVLTPRSFRLRRQDDMLCHVPHLDNRMLITFLSLLYLESRTFSPTLLTNLRF